MTYATSNTEKGFKQLNNYAATFCTPIFMCHKNHYQPHQPHHQDEPKDSSTIFEKDTNKAESIHLNQLIWAPCLHVFTNRSI